MKKFMLWIDMGLILFGLKKVERSQGQSIEHPMPGTLLNLPNVKSGHILVRSVFPCPDCHTVMQAGPPLAGGNNNLTQHFFCVNKSCLHAKVWVVISQFGIANEKPSELIKENVMEQLKTLTRVK